MLVYVQVPVGVSNVPTEVLNPSNSWKDQEAFSSTLEHLADLYTVRPQPDFSAPCNAHCLLPLGHGEQTLQAFLQHVLDSRKPSTDSRILLHMH